MNVSEFIREFLLQKFITKNDCYTKGRVRYDTRGLTLHSVGCSQPNADVFVNGWNKPGISKGVHAFIDATTGYVTQILPWNWRAWHVGNTAGNDFYIGVEMCESCYITYTSGSRFTVQEGKLSDAQKHCKTAYQSAVYLFAYLCKEYHLSPSTIKSHKEMYAAGIGSGHGDPEHYWEQLQMPYTMNRFRDDVQKAINGSYVGEFEPSTPTASATPAPTPVKKYQLGVHKVTASSLNARSGPGTENGKIGSFPKGDYVDITALKGDWGKCKVKGTVCWVHMSYLEKVSTITCSVDVNTSLVVRSGPSTSHSKLGSMTRGQQVLVISTSNGWSRYVWNGYQAYSSSKYLKRCS